MQYLIPYAAAVALSPMPIAALLLILLSKRAKLNSIFFMLGWLLGILLLVVVAMQFALTSDTTGPRTFAHFLNAGLGILLILFALKQLHNRPKKGKTAKVPKWMSTIENFSPIKSFGIGIGLAIFNFKNMPMGIAAGVVMSEHVKTTAEMIMGLSFYVLLSGSTIIVPVFGFLFFGNKLQRIFKTLKEWLVSNNATIMFVLFLILGLLLLSKAF